MLERIRAQFVCDGGSHPHARIVCMNGVETPDFFTKVEGADTIDQLYDLGAITEGEGHLLLDALEASPLPLSESRMMNLIAHLPFGEAVLDWLGRASEAHIAAQTKLQ